MTHKRCIKGHAYVKHAPKPRNCIWCNHAEGSTITATPEVEVEKKPVLEIVKDAPVKSKRRKSKRK